MKVNPPKGGKNVQSRTKKGQSQAGGSFGDAPPVRASVRANTSGSAPITYSVNGKQYVAVSTGTSLVSSGVNRLAPDLKPTIKNAIYVFSLSN